VDNHQKKSGQLIKISEEVEKIVTQYSKSYRPVNHIGRLWQANMQQQQTTDDSNTSGKDGRFYEEIKSSTFDATHLETVVEEIKLIEEGLKTLVAARTKKIIEEKVPVEKQRPVKYGLIRRALLSMGLIRQKIETYIDFETLKKEVPREPGEVALSEFRTMIDRYISNLKYLNKGLLNTVMEVDNIVRNLTDVSDAYTDQIHTDRKAYYNQVQTSRALESKLKDLIAVHQSLSPLNDRFPEVEKARDHLEMALRDSQSQEFKHKTSVDMNVNYQSALKSYRKLINDFRERGHLHVNMVEKFSEGASHMKIAIDNVSQICSGVARVTQSMIMIVESIEGGNKVLGRYAALIGNRVDSGTQWDMEYEELKKAEAIYLQNDEVRLKELEKNRKELEMLSSTKPEPPPYLSDNP
jgi:tetratricopeptide (TPR) repeat protein